MKLSASFANAKAAAAGAYLDGGTVEVYAGAIPATADTAIAAQTLLGTIALNTPAFLTPVDGVAALSLPPAVTVVANGVATFARWKKAGGQTAFDSTAGASGTELILSDENCAIGNEVEFISFSYTQPKG